MVQTLEYATDDFKKRILTSVSDGNTFINAAGYFKEITFQFQQVWDLPPRLISQAGIWQYRDVPD
jgi:hypothetical protein